MKPKKAFEPENDGDTSRCWSTWKGSQKSGRETGWTEDGERIETIQTTALFKIGLDIWKRLGVLKRLAVNLDFSEKLQ